MAWMYYFRIAFIKASLQLSSSEISWSEWWCCYYNLSIIIYFFGILLFMFSLLLSPLKSCSFLFVYSIFPLFRSINQRPLLFTKWLLSRDLFVTLFAHVKHVLVWCVSIKACYSVSYAINAMFLMAILSSFYHNKH